MPWAAAGIKNGVLRVHSAKPGTYTGKMIITTLTQVARGKVPVEAGSVNPRQARGW